MYIEPFFMYNLTVGMLIIITDHDLFPAFPAFLEGLFQLWHTYLKMPEKFGISKYHCKT